MAFLPTPRTTASVPLTSVAKSPKRAKWRSQTKIDPQSSLESFEMSKLKMGNRCDGRSRLKANRLRVSSGSEAKKWVLWWRIAEIQVFLQYGNFLKDMSQYDCEIQLVGGLCTLVLDEVFPDDEGEYTVVATNNSGSAKVSGKLSVKGSPKVLN